MVSLSPFQTPSSAGDLDGGSTKGGGVRVSDVRGPRTTWVRNGTADLACGPIQPIAIADSPRTKGSLC